MLQFYNFLTLLSEYRQTITQYDSDTITILNSNVTDWRLSVDLIISVNLSSTVEAKTSITVSVNDDGDVKTEIMGGTYDAYTVSQIEFVTLVMSNCVNAMLRSIEEAKGEVLGSE